MFPGAKCIAILRGGIIETLYGSLTASELLSSPRHLLALSDFN